MIDQVVSGGARHEIAFVSGDVPDLQNLLLGMRAGIEVVVLDPASDGVVQIAQALAGRSGLDAIHLIGHGAAGALQLGDAVLDAAYIAAHADALAFIGGALNGGGDILVYGCDTGAGSVGDAFLHSLADATGADVAASTDPTGGTAAGGDWTLEASVGQVDTAGAIAAGEAYAATLALTDGTAHTYSANTWAFSAMAKDGQGNVYLAHKIDSTSISLKKWTGSGWTELKQLKITDTGDTSFSDDLSLTVNANGKLDLLFRNDKATNGDFIGSARGVKFAEFDPVGNTWKIKQIEQASDPSGWKNFDDPMIATGAGNKMYAVYNYADVNNPRTYNIKFAESSDGGTTWSTSTLLTTLSATDELKNPKIAVDADGTVHVFYVREDSQNVNYGNLYEMKKAANASTWSAATKLADNLTSAYSMTSDGQGHFYLGYGIRTANASNQTTGTNLYVVSNDGGSWGAPSLVLNEARVDLVGQMQYADGKPYMLVNSRTLDNSATDIYVMRKDATGWTHGVQGESALPALSMQGTSQAFGERNFIVKSGGDIIVVAEDSGLRNIYYSAGTSNDFGLFTNTAPVITGLGGDHGTFSAGVTGTANLVNDNAYIDVQLSQNDAVGVADDSADFAGGSILILQTAGTANGSFVLDDGAEVTGTLAPGGTIYYNNQVVGHVNALLDGQGGHNLLIEFTTANANKLVAENIVKFLMYSAPTAGTRSFMLTIDDGDGGTSVPATFSMQGMDVTKPTVTGVTSSSDNGSYKTGDTITIQVQFSEAVNVTGTPKLVLETGATDHAATYASGSGTNTLSFNYTVQAGDTSSDLDAIATGALQLNGGTIVDAAGNAAVLALPASGAAGSLGANKAIVVDGLAPSDLALSNATVTTLDGAHAVVGQLSSTDATSGDSFTYTLVSGTGSTDNAAFEIVGQSLKAIDASSMLEGAKSVRVRTTDAAGNSFEKVLSITVNTPPTVSISSDKSIVKAGDTAAITFHFSSAPTGFDLGDVSVTGGTLASLAVDQNDPAVYHAIFTPTAGVQSLSGAISIGAGKFVGANGLGNIASTSNAAIGGDTALAAVTGLNSTSDNGSYKTGDTITIQVQFSETVNVTGTPKLVLETGVTDHAATYSSGSGTNTLSFNYTVQAGDTSTDLDAIATGALQLNGGTIVDAAGNAAVLVLPAPGAAGSLGANKAIVVDGLAPSDLALSNATVTTLDGAHAVVGTLSSTDATSGDSFTYSLVSGTGSTDNAAFEIVGQSLKAINASSMLEGAKSVRVRTTDAAGNSFEKVLSITVNTPPTVSISSDKSIVKAGDTAAITFHFSSAPTGFDLGDVSVTGGTLGSLAVDQNDPAIYHAIFTPTAGVQSLSGAISIGAGKFVGANGLGNIASTSNAAIGGDTALAAVTGVTSSSDNGSYKTGDTITIQVQFSETVNVTGTPKLVLETGATDHAATYSSGSGTNTLSFNYTVQAGDASTDLDAIATGALQLNGGTIVDAAGNAAVPALPASGAAGSLGANKAIVVDGLAPSDLALSNATVTTLDGAHAVVGQLSSTDATSGDSFTYSLVSGTGSTDNAAFEIVGQSLKAIDASSMLEGAKSVRVRTTDAAGNSFEKVLSITVNTPPTVSISSDKSTVKAGDTAAITFHFSSAPTGFDLGDVSVTGGTLASLAVDQNDPAVYHAIFTPTAGVQSLSGAISIGAGKFVGANGLGNIASTSNAAIGGDTALPGVTLSADRTQFKAGDSAAVTFTFSEVPVGFGQASVNVSGGTLSGLTVDQNDAKVYHATFTPSAGVQSLSGAISIDAASFLDAAGNAGTAGANVLSFGGDTRAPVVTDASLAVSGATGSNGSFRIGDTVTVAWNDGAAGDHNGDTAAVTVDFSPFGGPAAATATLANGVWQASFQVTAGAIDAASLHAGITVTDLAGNATTHTGSAGVVLDNAAPAASDAALSLSGATGSGGTVRIGDVLTATWNGPLDGNADVASVSFDFSQFGGPAAVGASAVNGVWSASWTVAAGTIDASGRNVVMTVLDDAGNATTRADSAGLRVDTVAPQVASIAVAGTPAANATSVEFTVSLSEAVSGLNAADFTLAATGAAGGTIASVTGSGTTYTVRVDGIAGNGSLQLQLHDALNPIVDGAGNQMQGDYTAGAVHATSFNALPVIGSNGGGASATINVPEKQLAVTTVNATDPDADTIGYSISGGLDASLFEIDAASGVLRFKSAPLSAAPADSGHDNVYEVEVMAADGKGGIDKQLLSVNVQADLDGDGTADANDNDIDNDGRPNSIEDAVPGAIGGNGDGNGDGTPDSAQLNVASLPTVVAGAPYATLETAAGLTLSSVSSLAAASGLPRNVKMPVGQFDFTIGNVAPGGTATVSLYVDAALHVNGYFKQDAGGNWVNLATSVTTVGSKTKVTFSLVDGGVYDSDHLANGSITDPGGLATVAALIGSNGGTPVASIAVLEGYQQVTKVEASGTGTVSYAIVGGADAALFVLDPDTGVLRFKSVPDFDLALDAGYDNVYDVKVQATDAYGSDVQTLQVRVLDVPPPSKEIDGVQVVTDNRSNGDGTSSQVITVPVVQPTRTDSVGNNNVADVPLVTANDGKPVLSAQVPTGVGLQVSGSAVPVGVGTGLTDLIREIKGVTVAGSHDQGTMTAGGSGFLSALSSNASLVVQTVVPTAAAGTAAAQPVVITGTPAAANGPLTALVIDAHRLPSGSEIQLQDVSFAAVVGNVRVTGGAGSQTVWADGGSQYIVLGADDDVLHGGAGNDTVGSEGGNDHVYGDEGNDLVFGGLGNDYVDGGSGIDTVQLVGSGRADYSIRVDGSGNLVFTHRNGGVDGVDTVANVEVLRFTHAHADSSQQGSVARLAEAITGTAAAPAALQGWMAELKGGATLAQVAQHMLAANAAQQPAANADFVKALYVHTFGRAADAGGLAYWTEALAGGKLTRAEVSLAVADSAEKMAMPATVQLDVGATDYGTLVRMYDAMFGRTPDTDGINYWLARSEAGVSLATIADAFVQSSEAVARFGTMSDTQFVESLYHIALHRDGSQADVAGWATQLGKGSVDRGDVLLQFAESAEKIGLIGVVSTTIVPDGHA